MKKTIFGKTYLSIGYAANLTGMARMTMYRWALNGKTPSGEPLDVVHDSVKKQYFITDDSLQPLALKQQEIANMAEEERFTSVHNFTQRLV